MIEKFLTTRSMSGQLITPVAVERETDSSVWIRGRRSVKSGGYGTFHDSYREAKLYLEAVADGEVRSAILRLSAARDYEGNVKELRDMSIPKEKWDLENEKEEFHKELFSFWLDAEGDMPEPDSHHTFDGIDSMEEVRAIMTKLRVLQESPYNEEAINQLTKGK